MTIVTAASTAAPTCEARVGFYPGDYGELPLWCSARIGLTVWQDHNGVTHRACRHHVDAMRARFRVQEEERVERVISEASRPLRAFERRTVVVEEGPGYVVTADLEPPAHNHFDDRDAPWDIDACPRCRWDVDRAEGF